MSGCGRRVAVVFRVAGSRPDDARDGVGYAVQSHPHIDKQGVVGHAGFDDLSLDRMSIHTEKNRVERAQLLDVGVVNACVARYDTLAHARVSFGMEDRLDWPSFDFRS